MTLERTKGNASEKRSRLLTRSDIAANNKWYRLAYKIESRIEYFTKMMKVQHPNFKTDEIKQACFEQTNNMRRLLSRLHSVGFNYIIQRELGDISQKEHEIRLEQEENRKTMYQEVYDEVKAWPKRKEHFEESVCLVRERKWLTNDLSENFLKMISDTAKESAIKRIEDRLWLQIHDSHMRGWFITFSTLTVNSEWYEDMFIKGSDMWRNYIRKIKRRVGSKCYDSWREAEKMGYEYFHFFAVTERGSQGRLHIHMMLFMKDIWFPDPNAGLRIPKEEHIKDRTLFWPYGIEQHIAVRFSNGDAWGMRGWKWRWNEAGPIPQSKAIKIAQYITKYLEKTERIKTTGDTESWKIRTNHQMGRTKLMRIISKLPRNQLEALVMNKTFPIPIILESKLINSKLIRNLAVKELLYRGQHKNLNRVISPKNTALKQLLQNMNQKKCARNYASIGELTEQLLCGVESISDKYIKSFYDAKNSIEQSYQ